MIVAVLSMTGLGVLAAKIFPRTYTSTALLLLQESNKDRLFHEPAAVTQDRIQERVAGLQALLKSEHVLARALRDFPDRVDTGVGLEPEMDGLRRNLSLELVGTDFLEIRLKSGKRDGLGRRLTIIIGRLLEALLPDQRGVTALQMLAEEGKARVERAEQRVADVKARISASADDARASPEGAATASDGVIDPSDARELEAAQQALAEAQDQLAVFTKRYGVRTRTSSILNAPERIMIVDPARDPKGANIAGVIFVLAGFAAGVLLAVVLAATAELLDPTLRQADDFARIAGVEVLAQLPHYPGAGVDALARKTG